MVYHEKGTLKQVPAVEHMMPQAYCRGDGITSFDLLAQAFASTVLDVLQLPCLSCKHLAVLLDACLALIASI